MKDLEKFKELYDSLGVNYVELTIDAGAEFPTVLQLTAQETKHIEGYIHFYIDICFDHDGKFICQQIWE